MRVGGCSLQASQQARRRQLVLYTYAVVPFTEESGMLQVSSSLDAYTLPDRQHLVVQWMRTWMRWHSNPTMA
jgi:hypothetical protein